MFPTKFVIDKYLKRKTWECHPVLPHVDAAKLVAAVERCAARGR
jgi:5'-3' exonuclease